MAQTFDIRFAKSEGLAAFFEAAGNRFGWRGGGRLSIDADGMSFALKRGIVTLLTRRRSQRIAAGMIREVYREGDALRVEFACEDNPRTVLPFWASDHEAAAQIVQLLPTSRTFEVEHGPTGSCAKKTPGRRWNGAVGAITAGIAAALVWYWKRPDTEVVIASAVPSPPIAASVPAAASKVVPVGPVEDGHARDERVAATTQPISTEEARKLAILAEEPVDWTSPPAGSAPAVAPGEARIARTLESLPATQAEDEGFVPMEVPEIRVSWDEAVVGIPPTTLAHRAGRELLERFAADAAALSEDFRRTRARFDAGAVPPQLFADELDSLARRWLTLNERLLQNRNYSDPALTGLRATLMAVLIQQRLFLSGYGAGLRINDRAAIEHAFQELARAEQLLQRAWRYLG
jgi:hypothetical protein